jgi:transposase-like protein
VSLAHFPGLPLEGEESISALCRREGIAGSLCYSWSKEFLGAGKQRLAGEGGLGHPVWLGSPPIALNAAPGIKV